ncbi:hypothetical protein C0583_00090 [Candidatus Parcubacteria bacterium]|nr:MAG: hypothetical protein C0583_00090 [Candidatus Parcubacteria bacterium]
MKLIEINKEQLNSYTKKQKQSQFLQSWEWGEFQMSVGHEVFRLGTEENGQIKFAFSAIKNKLPMGKAYLYIPRVSSIDEEILEELKNKFSDVLFVRIEPTSQSRIMKYELRKTIDIQASRTSIVDMNRPEEDVLKSFHQKTRYNIRLADKKGVQVRVGTKNDFEDFLSVMTETSGRDGFRLHAKEYYMKQLEIPFVELIVATYEGKIIAGNIVSFFGDMASYIHGSSSNEYRYVMAPFAIQWYSMKLAKEKGMKYYDLNGIGDKWPGVTRFKRGFKGEEIEYPGCFDVIFNKGCYNRYQMLRKIRRMIGRIINK